MRKISDLQRIREENRTTEVEEEYRTEETGNRRMSVIDLVLRDIGATEQ